MMATGKKNSHATTRMMIPFVSKSAATRASTEKPFCVGIVVSVTFGVMP